MTFASITSAFRDALLQDSDLVAQIGQRVYSQTLPQNPTFPCITFQQLSSEVIDDVNNNHSLEKVIFQVDVWSNRGAECNSVSELLRQAISGYAGMNRGVKIKAIRLTSRRDRYEPEVKNYRKIHDFEIWHKELNLNE